MTKQLLSKSLRCGSVPAEFKGVGASVSREGNYRSGKAIIEPRAG